MYKQLLKLNEEEIKKLNKIEEKISKISDDDLETELEKIFDEAGIDKPWEGDFDEFMNNTKNVLNFE